VFVTDECTDALRHARHCRNGWVREAGGLAVPYRMTQSDDCVLLTTGIRSEWVDVELEPRTSPSSEAT
jgi:hypothetical protein